MLPALLLQEHKENLLKWKMYAAVSGLQDIISYCRNVIHIFNCCQ